MRDHAYGIFEIMAWPAAVWCASELVLRTLVREPAGLAQTAVIGAMADDPYEVLGTWNRDGKIEDTVTPLAAIREMVGEPKSPAS